MQPYTYEKFHILVIPDILHLFINPCSAQLSWVSGSWIFCQTKPVVSI